MKLRVLLFFSIVIFVAGSSSVFAQTCSSDDTMFRLSSTFNAHVSLYNETSYKVHACYSSLFGEPHPSNPHNCSTSPIFRLFNASNSHISVLSRNYTVPVCYADLVCYFDDNNSVPGCAIQSSYTVVARASARSNAHLSNATYPNTTLYPYKICCGRQTPPIAEWRDINGNKLSTVRAETETAYATLTYSAGIRDIKIYEGAITLHTATAAPSVSSPNWTYNWTPAIVDVNKTTNFDSIKFEVDNNPSYRSGNIEVTFCGDGKEQVGHGEQCDTGWIQDPRPSNPPYGAFTTYCNASTCQLISVSGGYCGDKIIQSSNETCDLGTGRNGNISNQSGAGPGQFCTIDCRNETWAATDMRWEDNAGREISYAGRGNTVRLVYRNGAATGKTFKIYSAGKKNFFGDVSGSASGSHFVGGWSIPRSLDLKKYKKVVFTNTGRTPEQLSNNLTVTTEGDKPIKIKVKGITCGEVVNKGAPSRTVNITIQDPDDLISGYVQIDGTKVDTFTKVSSYTYSKPYAFTKEGTIKFEVFAENSRGEKASAVSNILVNNPTGTAKTFTAACITKPDSFQYIKGDYIEFNASSSAAIRQPSPAKLPLSALTFEWKFSDGMSNPYKSGSQIRSREFNKSFSSNVGYNWADLTVTA